MMGGASKRWNWFEIIFLISGLLIVLSAFLWGEDKNYLSLCVSLSGVVAVLFTAKGLIIAPIMNIIYNLLYAILAFQNYYYGDVIIYVLLMIPISIISLVQWLKNKNADNQQFVQINQINRQEFCQVILWSAVGSVGFYFLLQFLHTDQLIASTFSLVTLVMASYLLLRRCSYYALAFLINDVRAIVLWSYSTFYVGLEYLPTLLTFCIFLVNDTYGFVRWRAAERQQKALADAVIIG